MSVVVPTMLKRANSEGENVYQETSTRLLELAASDQQSFRGVVGGLSEGQRAFMERVISAGRRAGQGKSGVDGEEGREPTIALRMDFGA